MKNLPLYRVRKSVEERRPQYEPSEKLQDRPIIYSKDEFETLIVEMLVRRNATGKKPIAVVENQH
jgi:hypothetical protein